VPAIRGLMFGYACDETKETDAGPRSTTRTRLVEQQAKGAQGQEQQAALACAPDAKSAGVPAL